MDSCEQKMKTYIEQNFLTILFFKTSSKYQSNKSQALEIKLSLTKIYKTSGVIGNPLIEKENGIVISCDLDTANSQVFSKEFDLDKVQIWFLKVQNLKLQLTVNFH